ncbi:outer membrane protein [Flavobacterium arsenatis]|uniref:Outer membrane protein n=1 Tax=Flavobacterium arsenatis TaxID=1484332 RepID=A0ABU1TKP7_9FLAO|nr:OmpH family outer membrane protein [Flavobacterium arsenatis]MDR6966550.1 outer membrane protein [Flavobacterium arsenatis]
MKQLKTLLLAAVLFFGANQVNAQTKIAHVNVEEIMTKMPAVIDAQKQIEKLSQTYEADFTTMRNELQTKLQKYSTEAEQVTDAINKERSKEVEDMERRIQDFGQNAQKELQQKQMDLMKPIQLKIKASIEKVGKAKGFQYVADMASFILVDGTDLTADVKKDLGF